jgi:NAD(P)H dehydrogenase (quinone)
VKVLIVFAHPEPKSFNGALLDTAATTLAQMGHDVTVSDLYRMKFKAVLDCDDFAGQRLNGEFLDISAEQENMYKTCGSTADVAAEQEKVLDCDMLIFQYPTWWFSMPAILKGWVDRTMTRGFAYEAGRKYSSGKFKGRRAMICTTTGTSSNLYQPDGIDGDINHILWPIHNGIFNYLGFHVLPPFVAWMPKLVSQEQRAQYLHEYAQRLQGIEKEEPLFFHPREDYGEDQRLKPNVIARTGFQWNPRAGQDRAGAAEWERSKAARTTTGPGD